jgi:hypothetical protein
MKTSAKITIGLISLGIVGVGTYLYVQVQKIINAPFKITGAKDVDVSGGEIKFTLISHIINESNISAYVKDQYYEVFLNDKQISKIENKSEIFVGAAHKYDKIGNLLPNDAIIPLRVEINKKALTNAVLVNLTNLVADKSKIKLSIKGYFTWTAGIIKAKQPFELTYTLQEIFDMNKKP